MKIGALYLGERCVLPRVRRAVAALDRMRGLLALPPLQGGEGLLIESCSSVHTIGMRYSLDLAFIDRHWVVRKLVYGVRPFRLSAGLGSVRTLETSAGELRRLSLNRGDVLSWREAA